MPQPSSGTPSSATAESGIRVLAERGIYFTVGVEVLYSPGIRAIARAIPRDLLLTETDNPGGLRWLAATSGMPGILVDVVEKLAELRGWTFEDTAQIVWDNFSRLMPTVAHQG